MTDPIPIQTSPWTTALHHHDLVPFDDSQIEVSISGPPRTTPSTPLVIIEHGHGASLYEWVVAARHISSFARVLTYSRAGYGRSIASDKITPRTTNNISRDLHSLLEKLEIPPPYVLVGHSYGGNIVRTFLSLYPEEVAGMVLVDSYCVYEPMFPDYFGEFLGPEGMVTYGHVLGLTANHVFAPDEWQRMLEMSQGPSSEAAGAHEGEHFVPSVNGVNEMQGLTRMEDGKWNFSKQVLGDGRISVLSGSTTHDMTRLYANALEKGYGSEESRKKFVEWKEEWTKNELGAKACALSLSSDGRLVQMEGLASTHNVHFLRPDLVAEEVRWVLKLEPLVSAVV